MPIPLPGGNKELLEYMQIRHPYWQERSDEWNLHDLVRNRISPLDYLVKGHTETQLEYNQRRELAIFTPETPMVVQRIIGFMKRNDSDRDLGGNSDLETFVRKSDKKERPFGDVVLDAITRALWLESCFILVDRKSAERDENGSPVRPTSRAEADAMLGRPYLTLYPPTSIVNWWVGDNGKLEWITLRSEYYYQSDPFDLREKRIQYRIFNTSSWVTITIIPRRKGNENKNQLLVADESDPEKVIIEISQGDHNLGKIPIVPVIPFQVDQENVMTGSSFTKAAVRNDLAAWRQESDYRYNLWLHNHPKLCIRADSDSTMQLTSSTAIHLDPDKDRPEDAFYISPDSSVFEHSREAIRNDRESIWIQTYQDAAQRIMEGRQDEQSGYHKRLSFEMAEGTILSHLTDIEVQVEKDVLEIVSRYFDSRSEIGAEEKIFDGVITRKKSYDVFWVGDYIKIAQDASQFLQASPKAIAGITTKIVQALLDSPPADEIEKISQEILLNKTFLTGNVERLVQRVEALKAIDSPSEELIRKLHVDIARELISVAEEETEGSGGREQEFENNQRLLDDVIAEIESADISLDDNNSFENRLGNEFNASQDDDDNMLMNQNNSGAINNNGRRQR